MVYAVQGEKNARKIRFYLFNNGIQWVIDKTASVLISYKKPDGHGGMYDVLDNGEPAFEFVTGSTNSVIITLAEQVLTTVGNVPLLISFMVGDEILSTFNIALDVSENPGIDVAESVDYFSLSVAIDAAKKVVGDMLDPDAFASKEYVEGLAQDIREEVSEVADDAKAFYVTISQDENRTFSADKNVAIVSAEHQKGRMVKAVVTENGEEVSVPLIGIIEGDTAYYAGYGAYGGYIVVSQTDDNVSVQFKDFETNSNITAEDIGAIPSPDTAEIGQTIVVKEVDTNGKPVSWEAADFPSGGGGGSSSNGGAFRLEMTLEEDVSDVQFLLPTNWANILQFHVRMDNEAYRIAADMKTYIICGGQWKEVATLPAQTLALDIYGIVYQRWGGDRRLFAIGVNSATNATDACLPVFPNNQQALANSDSNILRIHSETVGVVFPAGAHFEVWGVYAS